MSAFVTPPFIRPGERVAVIAPASPFPEWPFREGLARLRDRYDVRVEAGIRSRTGYLAGDDTRRGGELARAMMDPAVRAIFCARGGYGVMRTIRELPWDSFCAAPKWIIGFSDVTALHLEALSHGVRSLHAPNVTGFGNRTPPIVRHDLLCILEGVPLSVERSAFADLQVVHPTAADAASAHEAERSGMGITRASSDVEGAAFGGNLALVHAMAAAGRLQVPVGCIFFLEDVTERPYRVDRMLTSLALGGHFANARALVFGDFDSCEPGPDGVTIPRVLADCTRALGIPVFGGAPFGHGAVNRPWLHGGSAWIRGGSVYFTPSVA